MSASEEAGSSEVEIIPFVDDNRNYDEESAVDQDSVEEVATWLVSVKL